jgi:hypothetical protein
VIWNLAAGERRFFIGKAVMPTSTHCELDCNKSAKHSQYLVGTLFLLRGGTHMKLQLMLQHEYANVFPAYYRNFESLNLNNDIPRRATLLYQLVSGDHLIETHAFGHVVDQPIFFQ